MFSIGLKPPTSNVFTSFSCKLSQRFQIIYLEEDHDKEEADLTSRFKMGQADDGVTIKLTNVYSKLLQTRKRPNQTNGSDWSTYPHPNVHLSEIKGLVADLTK